MLEAWAIPVLLVVWLVVLVVVAMWIIGGGPRRPA
jgi:hypothetical protein